MADCLLFARGARLPFLSKYKETMPICDIIDIRDTVLKIAVEIVNSSPDSALLSRLPANLATAFAQVSDKRAELAGTYKKRLNDYAKCSLVDFNYTVKVAMGSDTSSVVKMPVVNLELFVKDVNNVVERVVLELNKEELKTFIEQLARIQKVLDVR